MEAFLYTMLNSGEGQVVLYVCKEKCMILPYKFLTSTVVPHGTTRAPLQLDQGLLQMSFEEDRNDGEASVTDKFRESVSKFTFSTPCQPQLNPVVATVHSSELPTLRRSSRVAAVVTPSRNLEIKCDFDNLSSTSPGKGKRKARNTSLSKNAAKKLKRGYAPPEAYAHLSPLTDYLAYGLNGV